MHLHEFLVYMLIVLAAVYGFMFVIEKIVQKKGQIVQSVLSTLCLYAVLIGIGVVFQFHVLVLYAFGASAFILLNRFWLGHYTTEMA